MNDLNEIDMALGNDGIIDWEGISLHDHSRYEKIRRVLKSELKDNLETVGLVESFDEVESASAEEVCERTLAAEGVRKAKNSNWSDVKEYELQKRERKVLELYYFDGLLLEEIAWRFDVTRERIRQILSKTLQRLRHPKRVKVLREIWESI